MPQIYISYRSADNRYFRERMYEILVQKFGKDNVHWDLDNNSQSEELWQEVLVYKLRISNVMLVIIGNEWEYLTNELAHDMDDIVRYEVEFALNRPDKCLVIPILIEDASKPEQLPDSIQALFKQKFFSVRFNPHFEQDFDAVLAAIKTYDPPRPRWLKALAMLIFIACIFAVLNLLGDGDTTVTLEHGRESISEFEAEHLTLEAMFEATDKAASIAPSEATSSPTNTPTRTPEPTTTPEPTIDVSDESRLVEAITAANDIKGVELFVLNECHECHTVDDTETVIVGPPLYNIFERAGSRIEGLGQYTYIYESIVHHNDYIVEGYIADPMLTNYSEGLTNEQVVDIIAFLAILTPDETPEPAMTPEPEAELSNEARLAESIAAADIARGEYLFMVNACTGCHSIDDSEVIIVGPSLYNVIERAENRIEGIGKYTYIYNSIVNPDEYVVEGYGLNLMPPMFGETLSEEQLFDLIAYLATLHD